jgi:hypothetical protein
VKLNQLIEELKVLENQGLDQLEVYRKLNRESSVEILEITIEENEDEEPIFIILE